MRISDWSSDVCSSDLRKVAEGAVSKAVVEVNVGGDDVADRPVGGDSDGRAQRLALSTRCAGIHHGNALSADAEAEFVVGAEVLGGDLLVVAEAHADHIAAHTEENRDDRRLERHGGQSQPTAE